MGNVIDILSIGTVICRCSAIVPVVLKAIGIDGNIVIGFGEQIELITGHFANCFAAAYGSVKYKD